MLLREYVGLCEIYGLKISNLEGYRRWEFEASNTKG